MNKIFIKTAVFFIRIYKYFSKLGNKVRGKIEDAIFDAVIEILKPQVPPHTCSEKNSL